MIARKKSGQLFVLCAAAMLLAWLLVRAVGLAEDKPERPDAIHLLHQVSLFQLELMDSALGDAAAAKDTGQLNTLKQLAYSAGYAHERLALAVAPGAMTELKGPQQLLQYVTRLQIGGVRPLKPEEARTLQELVKTAQTLHEEYETLVTESGNVVASQNDKLRKTDDEMVELLRKKQ